MTLAGESWAIQPLSQIGDVDFPRAGLDRSPPRRGRRRRRCAAWRGSGLGAISLAVLGSVWLARTLTDPIDQLSQSLAAMAAAERARDAGAAERQQPRARSADRRPSTRCWRRWRRRRPKRKRPTSAPCARWRPRSTRAIRTPPAIRNASARFRVAIGQELELDADAMETLRLGALLHDIGKIGVPDEVLRKPGALTAGRVRGDQGASVGRRAHPAQHSVSRAAHPDRRAAPRAARRPRAIRTACAATRFRWPRASCTSPTRSTP